MRWIIFPLADVQSPWINFGFRHEADDWGQILYYQVNYLIIMLLCASRDMITKATELEKVLEKIISILEKHGERNWSEALRKSRTRIVASDYSGIELLLNYYGGMGSFNDFVIQPSIVKSEIEFTDDEIEANNKLNSLRSIAWTLAREIKSGH